MKTTQIRRSSIDQGEFEVCLNVLMYVGLLLLVTINSWKARLCTSSGPVDEVIVLLR